MEDKGGKALQTLAQPAAKLTLAILTHNPVGAASAVYQGVSSFFGQETDSVFAEELADFVFGELTKRVGGLEKRLEKVENDAAQMEQEFWTAKWEIGEINNQIDTISKEEAARRALWNDAIELLEAEDDLNATEVAAVLHEIQRVYRRTFDPEKRELVGSALRSCLLDRKLFQHGLRRQFLKILDELEFGDIAVLVAAGNVPSTGMFDINTIPKELIELREWLGITASDHIRNGFKPTSITEWHVDRLSEAKLIRDLRSLAIKQIIPTELGQRFIQFIDARPETFYRHIKRKYANDV